MQRMLIAINASKYNVVGEVKATEFKTAQSLVSATSVHSKSFADTLQEALQKYENKMVLEER